MKLGSDTAVRMYTVSCSDFPHNLACYLLELAFSLFLLGQNAQRGSTGPSEGGGGCGGKKCRNPPPPPPPPLISFIRTCATFRGWRYRVSKLPKTSYPRGGGGGCRNANQTTFMNIILLFILDTTFYRKIRSCSESIKRQTFPYLY